MLAVPSGNTRLGRGGGEGEGFDRNTMRDRRVEVKWRLVLNVIKDRSLITKRGLLLLLLLLSRLIWDKVRAESLEGQALSLSFILSNYVAFLGLSFPSVKSGIDQE